MCSLTVGPSINGLFISYVTHMACSYCHAGCIIGKCTSACPTLYFLTASLLMCIEWCMMCVDLVRERSVSVAAMSSWVTSTMRRRRSSPSMKMVGCIPETLDSWIRTVRGLKGRECWSTAFDTAPDDGCLVASRVVCPRTHWHIRTVCTCTRAGMKFSNFILGIFWYYRIWSRLLLFAKSLHLLKTILSAQNYRPWPFCFCPLVQGQPSCLVEFSWVAISGFLPCGMDMAVNYIKSN